jgi:hypothetical protein
MSIIIFALLGFLCAFVGGGNSHKVENLTVAAFYKSIRLDLEAGGNTLALFTDYECHESAAARCDEMRDYFVAASRKYYLQLGVLESDDCQERQDDGASCILNTAPSHVPVRFVNVHDRFSTILNATKLETIPRIVFFEHGMPVNVRSYHSAKIQAKDDALLQFLLRVLAPVVIEPQSEAELIEFLFPPASALIRDVEEDPVSFILIEPEPGCFLSLTRFNQVAKKFRTRLFFARVRLSDGGDWLKVLNLSAMVVSPPSLVRVEYGREPRVLLDGYDRLFESEDIIEKTVERHAFPSIAEIGANNAMDILENRLGVLVLVGLYSTSQEKKAVAKDLEHALSKYRDDFLFVSLNRTEYPDYLRLYLEAGDERFLVLDKGRGVFYLSGPRRQVLSLLENVLGDLEPKLYERGSRALPRLIRKAFEYRPITFILSCLGFLTLASLIISCSCGLRSIITGLDQPNFRVLERRQYDNTDIVQGMLSVSETTMASVSDSGVVVEPVKPDAGSEDPQDELDAKENIEGTDVKID